MNYIAIPGLKNRRGKHPSVDIYANRLSDIVEAVEKYFGITMERMKSKTRKREVVYARQICMYFICAKTNISLKTIGELFGERDHTTVIHSRDNIKNLIDVDFKVQLDIQTLLDKI